MKVPTACGVERSIDARREAPDRSRPIGASDATPALGPDLRLTLSPAALRRLDGDGDARGEPAFDAGPPGPGLGPAPDATTGPGAARPTRAYQDAGPSPRGGRVRIVV